MLAMNQVPYRTILVALGAIIFGNILMFLVETAGGQVWEHVFHNIGLSIEKKFNMIYDEGMFQRRKLHFPGNVTMVATANAGPHKPAGPDSSSFQCCWFTVHRVGWATWGVFNDILSSFRSLHVTVR